jgi:hypothetical protein
MPSDPSRLIAALARDRINLDLKTLDLCFLAGLYLRADLGETGAMGGDIGIWGRLGGARDARMNG